MSFTKNWYTRPTPPNMLFEERIFQSQFSVSTDKLYEWNIDGLSEQGIINKMGHMSMVAITYMNNHSLDHPDIVELLSTGFSGTLRGWWDSYLTEDSRDSIKHAVKMNDDGSLIFDEKRNSGIPDGVNTLVYIILKHFVSTLTNVSSRVSDYLNNLRCPTMSDYRWYQAVFLSRVMLRKDCKKPYLKEKFIDGLPPIFAHKNPELQKEYLDKFKKNLTNDENSKKLKSTISFEETLERFNKKKPKELTIDDLKHKLSIDEQNIDNLKHEFQVLKNDNVNIKQELLLIKVDKNLDKQQSDNEQDEHKERDDSCQEALLFDTDHTTNTTSEWIKVIRTTSKWNIMSSSASRKNKGKAPAQDYPQDKRILAGQSFVMHEGASSRRNSRGSTSLQKSVPVEVTFSSGDMEITLQEVIYKILQFHNGNFSELPTPVKVLLDNLQAAYTINHRKLFKKTLQALEIHLVNLTAQNEVYEGLIIDLSSHIDKNKPVNQPFSHNEAFASHYINHDHYISQLFGKEEIHSIDKMTLMGTNYAKLSLKTQFGLRCAIANLPSDIQKSILESKAMFRSFDLWYEYFKKLVTTSIPDPNELDVDNNVFIQLNWEEYFGKSSRV
ncbi:hypothetical protein SO802_029295 [Lithocarpus litseifolius]|uniref:DUF7746 domain-containing protein n=1 Tax=Lithocarpus litseifolius TaxID=425828 RepID=A0AAW2BSW1_9ROSI